MALADEAAKARNAAMQALANERLKKLYGNQPIGSGAGVSPMKPRAVDGVGDGPKPLSSISDNLKQRFGFNDQQVAGYERVTGSLRESMNPDLYVPNFKARQVELSNQQRIMGQTLRAQGFPEQEILARLRNSPAQQELIQMNQSLMNNPEFQEARQIYQKTTNDFLKSQGVDTSQFGFGIMQGNPQGTGGGRPPTQGTSQGTGITQAVPAMQGTGGGRPPTQNTSTSQGTGFTQAVPAMQELASTTSPRTKPITAVDSDFVKPVVDPKRPVKTRVPRTPPKPAVNPGMDPKAVRPKPKPEVNPGVAPKPKTPPKVTGTPKAPTKTKPKAPTTPKVAAPKTTAAPKPAATPKKQAAGGKKQTAFQSGVFKTGETSGRNQFAVQSQQAQSQQQKRVNKQNQDNNPTAMYKGGVVKAKKNNFGSNDFRKSGTTLNVVDRRKNK